MKKNLLFKSLLAIIPALALSTTACERVETAVEAGPDCVDAPVFHAFLEGADTKVYVNEDLLVRWHADDQISVFNKDTYNYKYAFEGATGDDSGTFQPIGDPGSGSELPFVYAVYPYNEDHHFYNESQLSVSLPAVQLYAEDSFGPGANTMVSVSEGDPLLFRNVGGYLVFKLYGEGVSVASLTLQGNDNELIAGDADVTASPEDAPSVAMSGNATSVVTLDCSGSAAVLGHNPESCTEFWFVLPPTTFSHGFTLTVTDNEGRVFEKSTEKSVEISRNHLSRMSPIEVVPEVPVLDIATILEKEDGSLVSCEDVIVLAASEWGAVVGDAEGKCIYLSYENHAVRGDQLDFTGVKDTVQETDVAYIEVDSVTITATDQPVPDLDWMAATYCKSNGIINTGSAGLLYQDSGFYYVASSFIDLILVEPPVDLDLTPYLEKEVKVKGYSLGFDGTTIEFLVNSVEEITFEANPNWSPAYTGVETYSGTQYDMILNTVSAGSDYYAIYDLCAYAIDPDPSPATILNYAKYESYRLSYIAQDYMTYYDETVADNATTVTRTLYPESAGEYGHFIFFVAGLDEEGYPSGKYAYVEYDRADHTVAAEYDDFIGEWNFGTVVIEIAEEVNGSTYSVSGLRGQDEEWPVIAQFVDGKFVLSEQVISGTETDGIILGGIIDGSYLSYPSTNSNGPDVLLTVSLQDDDSYLVTAGSNTKYSMDFSHYSFLTYSGGSFTDYTALTSIPSVMTVYVPDLTEYIFKEDFEDGDAVAANWTFIDADGDGQTWFFANSNGVTPHGGEGLLTSASYNNTALTPDNWAFTPAINFTSSCTLSFWVAAQDPAWPSEHFAVYISLTPDTEDCTTLLPETVLLEGSPAETVVVGENRTYERYVIPIPVAFADKTGYIGFRHFNCTDMFYINLDDVTVADEEIHLMPLSPSCAPAAPKSRWSYTLPLRKGEAPKQLPILEAVPFSAVAHR